LDNSTSEYFDNIISSSAKIFKQLEYRADITPQRAILHLKGQYGSYRIMITELLSEGIRKYRYYVLLGDTIEAGFDNAPDPRAIRMKYGKIGKEHAGENIPHLHLNNKTEIVLSDDMDFTDFY
jgi:hypothetical protein